MLRPRLSSPLSPLISPLSSHLRSLLSSPLSPLISSLQLSPSLTGAPDTSPLPHRPATEITSRVIIPSSEADRLGWTLPLVSAELRSSLKSPPSLALSEARPSLPSHLGSPVFPLRYQKPPFLSRRPQNFYNFQSFLEILTDLQSLKSLPGAPGPLKRFITSLQTSLRLSKIYQPLTALPKHRRHSQLFQSSAAIPSSQPRQLLRDSHS